LLNDIRYAVRTLLRTPAMTITALITLALGIGANTALFSVADAVLLRPLPFADADRLVLLSTTRPAQGLMSLPFSLPNFRDVQQQNQVFDGMAAWALGRFNLAADEPEQVQYAVTTSNFFELLGVTAARGRTFFPAEDTPASGPVVVISHSLWQRRFGSDPAIVGRGISLDGRTYEVVGVLPAGFRFLKFRGDTEVWLPLGPDPFVDRRYARAVHSMGVMARLAPGVTMGKARAEMETIAERLSRAYPENRGRGIAVMSLREQVVGNLRQAVIVLLGAVAFVLLIACANVASLLLTRANARQREMAIRSALGAGRGRLLRQLLTEHILLAAGGGVFGLIVGIWSLELFKAVPPAAPSLFVPYAIDPDRIRIDRTVLAFTATLSLLTGLVFGLMPALESSRTDVMGALKQGGSQSGGGRRQTRLRAALVVAEVAMAVTLLVGAALLVRTFVRLQQVDPGFSTENIVTFNVNLSPVAYKEPARMTGFFDAVIERARALPGALAAGGVEFLPLGGIDSATPLIVEGRPRAAPGEDVQAHYRAVTPDYFRAMGIRLVAGRELNVSDRADGVRVAVINETLARRFWPNENPLGRRAALTQEALRFRPDGPPTIDAASSTREIVGVVTDVRHSGLQTQPVPEMFVPLAQRPVRDLSIVVRTSGDPLGLARDLRQVVRGVDPVQPIASITSVADLVAVSMARPRFNLLLLSSFAALALMLAAVGVYGLMAFAVALRTREIGIRLALGGQARDVASLVVHQGMRLALTGLAIGLAGALALARIMAPLLFEIRPLDPLAFLAAAAVLFSVAFIATYGPARRAAGIDPIDALRVE
jgi:putative ABC transport system permease protein